ncbi:hypothetical protein [Microvirga makkahensis]|uniref:hypothetical protein n=1 Tax=Microvirga makkahensis TaxID=1128670 RepID=UPI00197BA9A6|nr:hypothetical protein [Microvirga makkahensis]
MTACAVSAPASAGVVGKVRTGWVGHDIVVEAIADPEVRVALLLLTLIVAI